MQTKTEIRMEKALYKIAEKIYWDFDSNFGYSFQGAPLTMFIYDFEKDTFHEKEVLKLNCGKIGITSLKDYLVVITKL